MRRKIFLLLFLLSPFLSALTGYAQDGDGSQKPEMADLLRSNGKIYVVVAVLATILVGFFLYLIRLDRKIGRLEKEMKP
jgi:CcmD family protein